MNVLLFLLGAVGITVILLITLTLLYAFGQLEEEERDYYAE
jgi:hypothetical protein